jgi:hypothetical protein
MSHERGQAMPEYLVGAGVLAAALLVPAFEGESALTLLWRALVRHFTAFGAALALA